MVWLVGASGMLGTEVSRQFLENKIDFTGTDKELDFTNYSLLEEFVKGKKIDFIVNCAAFTAVDRAESEKEAAEKLNVKGPENLARLSKKTGAVLIHISTDYVFDGTDNNPLNEDSPVNPLSVYGKTKAEGEKVIGKNTEKFYILRTSWLYGWSGNNFVYTMIKGINTKAEVRVVNDQVSCPTFAGDLAEVILRLVKGEKIPFGLYHFANSGKASCWDFAKEIKNQALEAGWIKNKDCFIKACSSKEYPREAERPLYSVLSKEKISRAMGIKITDWKESLKTFMNSPLFEKSRIE